MTNEENQLLEHLLCMWMAIFPPERWNLNSISCRVHPARGVVEVEPAWSIQNNYDGATGAGSRPLPPSYPPAFYTRNVGWLEGLGEYDFYISTGLSDLL